MILRTADRIPSAPTTGSNRSRVPSESSTTSSSAVLPTEEMVVPQRIRARPAPDRAAISPSRVTPVFGAYRSFDGLRSCSPIKRPAGSVWTMGSSSTPRPVRRSPRPMRCSASAALLVSSSASPHDKDFSWISAISGVIPNRSRLAASARPAIPAPTIRMRGLRAGTPACARPVLPVIWVAARRVDVGGCRLRRCGMTGRPGPQFASPSLQRRMGIDKPEPAVARCPSLRTKGRARGQPWPLGGWAGRATTAISPQTGQGPAPPLNE